MDRDRLKQVQQTDLTESRVNEDFVDWLKTKGLNWLLVLLIGLCAFVGWDYWKRRQAEERANAWFELQANQSPLELRRVAREYSEIAGVSELALLAAAETSFRALQANLSLDAQLAGTAEEPVPLDEEERERLLSEARETYLELLDRVGDDPGKRLFAVNAVFGLAALAEMTGEIDVARERYEQAAAIADEEYPALAAQARARLETLDELDTQLVLFGQDDVVPEPLIDPLLENVIAVPEGTAEEPPAEDGAAGDAVGAPADEGAEADAPADSPE